MERRLAAVGAAEGRFVHAADLTDETVLFALVAAVAERWGAADILINNAGVYPSGFLLDIDATEWDRIMDLNVRVPFLLTPGIDEANDRGRQEGFGDQHLVGRGA